MAAEEVIFKIIVTADSAVKEIGKVKDAFVDLDTDVGKIAKSLHSDLFSGLVSGLMKAGESILEFSIDAGRNFANFEDDLSQARRTMGLTRDETLDLGDSLIQLSTSFDETGLQAGISANELAKIAGQLGQLGYSARDNEDAFNGLVATVAKVSVAFGMSSAKAAESLGILQNLYGFTQEEFSNVASSIAYLGNTTVATSGQILDIMTRVGGIAGILGVSAQQMAGIASTLREAGVSAQVGGTAMSQIFSKLSSDVDKFGEVLGEGGLSSDMLRFKIESGDATGALKDVLSAIQTINTTQGKIAAIQALKDLGLQGVRVQQTLLALSNNIGGLNENLAASQQAFEENTAVNEAYNAAIDNSAQKWTQFQNVLDAIQKIIGKDLALAFGDFLENNLIPFTNHFKTWLEMSEGADKIFGENGLIAKGLQYVGQLLTDNEGLFFEWLDNIDANAGQLLDSLLAKFDEWFSNTKINFEEITNTAETALDVLNDFLDWAAEAKRTIEDVTNTVKFFWEELTKTNETLQFFMKPIADIINGTSILTTTMAGYTDGIKQGEQAMKDFGVTAVYRSVLPDVEAATISLTGKTLDYGTGIETVGGHTKKFYQIGMNAWSNINREIQMGTDAWHASGLEVVRGQKDVQFSLYQTGEAVAGLGPILQQVAVEAGNTAQVIASTADLTIKLKDLAGEFVQKAMAGNASSLQAIAENGGLSASDLQALMKQPGMLSAQGLIQASQAVRAQGWQNSGVNLAPSIDTTNMPKPSTASLNITFQGTNIVDERSVNNFAQKITAAQKQQQGRISGV